MNDVDPAHQALLEPGNTYHTLIRLDGRQLVLTQNSRLAAFWIAVFGAMGYAMSPWVGIPLLVIAGLYLVWRKSFRLSLTDGQIHAVSGIPPLVQRFRGDRGDVDHVELREVVMTRTTDGNQSMGKWRMWDITIHAFDGRFSFPAWEEGDDEHALRVAQALASLLNCPIKRVSKGRPASGH